MKIFHFILLFLLASTISFAQSDSLNRNAIVDNLDDIKLLDLKDSLGYAFGVTLSEQLKTSPYDEHIDRVSFIKGFIASYNNTTSMTLDEVRQLLTDNDPTKPKTEVEAVSAEDAVEVSEDEAEDETSKVSNTIKLEANEKKFFTENLQRAGIKTTKSGIQYELVLGNDKGAQPNSEDYIKVHYNATYLDDEQIDQTSQLSNVSIRYKDEFWKEIYTSLRVGSTYKFYLPTYFYSTVPVAYDVKVRKEAIIYTIELIGIESYDDEDDW